MLPNRLRVSVLLRGDQLATMPGGSGEPADGAL